MVIRACYFHGAAAVLAILSFAFWIQFHYKIGPIAINMSRVLLDVFTMLFILIVVIVSFSVGLAFVHATINYVQNHEATPPEYVFDVILLFAWATLAPGPPGKMT